MDDESELTEDQLRQMCWTISPITKSSTMLTHTPELEADYRVWLSEECQHFQTEVVCNILSNGTKQLRNQCIDCGKGFGTPVPHTKVPNIDDLRRDTVEHYFEYEKARLDQLRKIQIKHLLIQSRPGWGSSEYQEYLKSKEWLQKRTAVMRRANGFCEGCGMSEPAVVHHHHYRNIYNEWLWDLVALCRPCHDQCHPEHRAGDD